MASSEQAGAPFLAKGAVLRLLRRHELRAKKSLGQHFLVNPGALQRILAAAGLRHDDTIIEVGPGLGVLTRGLLAAAHCVIAVEMDHALAEILRQDLGADPHLTIVNGDMLELAPQALLSQANARPPYKVVANLPYNVAAPIIRRFLEAETPPTSLTVLVQREVAQGIIARDGRMSVLAVATQVYAVPSLAGIVRPGSFLPPPKVDSAILHLDVRPQPVAIQRSELPLFFLIVRAGFSAPRKQLFNSLAQGLRIDKALSGAILGDANVSPQRRAETLTIEEWAAIARAARDHGIHLP